MKNYETYADVVTETKQICLRNFIQKSLENYFAHLDPTISTTGLYEMVLKEVEIPLLESTLNYTKGNQFKAASLLGISRNTLRRKLTLYRLDSKNL